jgi:hypothetical protein
MRPGVQTPILQKENKNKNKKNWQIKEAVWF